MADATSSSVGELPTPDYVETTDDDPTLQMPLVIHYDEWRGSGRTSNMPNDESLPQPPADLLINEEDDDAFPEPPPDYDGHMVDDTTYPGLIPPHKLPNPVLDSRDRMQINKDIKFHARHGINVLNTKPELQKEMERRKVEKQKKYLAEEQRKNRNSLEQKLDLQKEKLNSRERDEKILEEQEKSQSELARIHNKIKAKAK